MSFILSNIHPLFTQLTFQQHNKEVEQMLTIMKLPQTLLVALLMTGITTFPTASSASQIRSELQKAADTKASGAYVRKRFLQMMRKPFTSTSKKKALIIGDSHAQDFLNGVLENGYLRNYQISTRYIPTRCQIYFGEHLTQFIKHRDRAFCKKSDSLLRAKRQIAEADLIILAGDWKAWSAKALPLSIKKLGLKPRQKLFVVGRKSFGKISIRNYLRMPDQKLRTLRNKVDAHQTKVNNIMSRSLSRSVFINQQQLICGSSATCPVFTKDLKLISFDGGHLTRDGARHVGRVLFQGSSLGRLP